MQFRRIDDFLQSEREFFERQLNLALRHALQVGATMEPRPVYGFNEFNNVYNRAMATPRVEHTSDIDDSASERSTIYHGMYGAEIPDTPRSPSPDFGSNMHRVALDLILPDSPRSPSPEYEPNREEFGADVIDISDVSDAGEETGDCCCICLSSMADKPTMRIMCNHAFHRDCLFTWLAESTSCPICRNIVNTI